MLTLEEIKKEVNYWINEYNAPNALKDTDYLNFLSRHIGNQNYPEIVKQKLNDESWQDLLNVRQILNELDEKFNDGDLYQREDGKFETYQETRQRVCQEFGELVKFFHEELEEELKIFEERYEVKEDKIGNYIKIVDLDLEKIKSISRRANLTQFFCGFGFLNHCPPKKLLYEMNYRGAKQKVDKLMETLDRIAWEVVGFTELDEQKKLEKMGWVRATYDHKYFIQEEFVGQGKRYKGFDPLTFREYEINSLIAKGYEPSDLDERGKYRGRSPLEKSKVEWDSSLNYRKWPQGKIISSVVLVAAVVVIGFSFILKKTKKNADE